MCGGKPEGDDVCKPLSKSDGIPPNKDTLMQIQTTNGDTLQGKVTCKIVPAQDTDYLLGNDTSKYDSASEKDTAGGKGSGGKGASRSGGGKKGKTIDKSRGMNNSRSGEGYQQIDNNSTMLTADDRASFRQDSVSSNGSRGQETPV